MEHGMQIRAVGMQIRAVGMQIRAVGPKSHSGWRKSSGRLRISIGLVLLLWLALSSLSGAESCMAPESMRSSLQGHPTAETFADLGIWFGEQKKYACAADDEALKATRRREFADSCH